MGEAFKAWLEKEREQAKRDSQSPDTWPRKNGQDRLDNINATLKMLGEFRAVYKDQKPDMRMG